MGRMSALILTLLLAQSSASPSASSSASSSELSGAVVMVSRRQGLSVIEATALADRLSRALADVRVPVTLAPDEALAKLRRKRPESCKGRVRCLAERGRNVGAAVVVTLQAVRILDDLPIRLMAINARTGQVLLERSDTAPAEQPAQLDAILRTAAREIAPELGRVPGCELLPAPEPEAPTPPKPPTPAPTPDVPRITEAPRLTPSTPTPKAEATPQIDFKAPDPAQPWRTVAVTGMAAGAVAAATLVGVAVGEVIYANKTTDASFSDTRAGSANTLAQTQEAIGRANFDLKVAGGAAGFAALCGLTALLLPKPAPVAHE